MVTKTGKEVAKIDEFVILHLTPCLSLSQD